MRVRHFIYNADGPTPELVASAPADVTCIARGWAPDAERAFIAKLQEIGVVSVSCLPCLLY